MAAGTTDSFIDVGLYAAGRDPCTVAEIWKNIALQRLLMYCVRASYLNMSHLVKVDCTQDCVLKSDLSLRKMDGWMNQAYSRFSTTHGHVTDCKLV